MMEQPCEPLPVRGVLEAFYYLMVQRCAACAKGPLDARRSRREFHEGVACMRLYAECRACRGRAEFLFDVTACAEEDVHDPSRTLGDPRPSRIIDLAQWLALFSAILRASSRARHQLEARQLGFEAAQCLDEAMKFYAPGQEHPGEEAFLSRESFELAQRHPDQFARSRLVHYRDRLPALGVMQARLSRDERGADAPGPWWRRWLRRGRNA